ncbi:MAG TPA: Zn-dependent hydrolase [Eoetvoesiella sp.]
MTQTPAQELNPQIQIDTDRLWQRVTKLAEFTRTDTPWTRRAFTPLFIQARQWLTKEFHAAGLEVRLDSAGNLIGRRAGRRPDAAPLVTGSHSDTVVGGGRFDGIIGVLAGLEIAQSMNEQGLTTEHPFEVIDFLSEEPSDYGVSCVGSRAMAGVLTPAMLAQTNPDDETLAAAIDRMGGSVTALGSAQRHPGGNAAFVELHIEQGPVLESRSLPIGVVTNIVGIRRVTVRVNGRPDHAGTTPMDIRHDALVGAACIITETSRQASDQTGKRDYVVATIGRLSLTPNVPNAVPGTVEMMLEVRSDNPAVLASFPEQILENTASSLTSLRLTAELQDVTRAAPTDCSPIVMKAVQQAAAAQGLDSMAMPSGAGHDAAYMAALGPMGMIFVPCLDGRSHCPEEWIDPQQLADGVRVLYQTLLNLDRMLVAP